MGMKSFLIGDCRKTHQIAEVVLATIRCVAFYHKEI